MMSSITDKDWFRALPNQLSMFRIAVVPVLLVLFPLDVNSINLFCAVLFMIAAMTDWLDGFIARRFSLESKLGALIDPIADKTLIAAAIILLAAKSTIWAWMAGIFICREFVLSGLRIVAIEQGFSLKVSLLAKWKTLFLDTALVCLMVNQPLFGWPFREVGMIALWLALFSSLYSGWTYIQEFLSRAKL